MKTESTIITTLFCCIILLVVYKLICLQIRKEELKKEQIRQQNIKEFRKLITDIIASTLIIK